MAGKKTKKAKKAKKEFLRFAETHALAVEVDAMTVQLARMREKLARLDAVAAFFVEVASHELLGTRPGETLAAYWRRQYMEVKRATVRGLRGARK